MNDDECPYCTGEACRKCPFASELGQPECECDVGERHGGPDEWVCQADED